MPKDARSPSWRIQFQVLADIGFDAIIGTDIIGQGVIDLPAREIKFYKQTGELEKAFSFEPEPAHHVHHSSLLAQRPDSLWLAIEANDTLGEEAGAMEAVNSVQISPRLSPAQAKVIRKILLRHTAVLTPDAKGEVGLFNGGDHAALVLRPTTNRYTRQLRVPQMPVRLREEWSKQLAEWVKQGVVEVQREPTPYLNPVVPVRKKNGQWRFTLDCRSINAVLQEENLVLDRPDQIAAQMAGNRFYTALDVSSFYLNFKLDKESRKYTTFFDPVSRQYFHFNRSIFGLRGSAAHSVNTLNAHLQTLAGYGTAIASYVDDFVIGTTTFEEHADQLEQLLALLERCSLKLKPSKMLIGAEALTIFGFRVEASGVQPDPERVHALVDVPPPTSRKQLVAHLAAMNYFRSHFPLDDPLAKYNAQLADLTTTKKPFAWNESNDATWSAMHYALERGTKKFVVENTDSELILRVDASRCYFGYLAVVIRNGEEFIVAANSKLWEDTITRWHCTRQELLAVLRSLKEIQHLCLGREVIVETDNPSAAFLLAHPDRVTIDEPSALFRALLAVAHIQFSVKKMSNKDAMWPLVDALSRKGKEFHVNSRNIAELLTPVEHQAVRHAPANIEPVALVAEAMPSLGTVGRIGVRSALRRIKVYEALAEQIRESDDYKEKENVPQELQLAIARAAHLIAHTGITRTAILLDESAFRWKNRILAIKKAIRQCRACSTKLPSRYDGTSGGAGTTATFPMQWLSMDLNTAGQGTATDILVVLDSFTGFGLTARIVGRSTTANILHALLLILFKNAPNCTVIKTDNGRNINGPEIKDALAALGIKLINAARHNSRGNARVERFNRKLNEQLRVRLDQSFNGSTFSPKSFDLVLADATLAANLARGPEGSSAFELLYGTSPICTALPQIPLAHTRKLAEEHRARVEGLRALREKYFRPPIALKAPTFKIGDRVRLQVAQSKGSNKFLKNLFSDDIFVIKSCHDPSRSYKVVKINDQDGPTTTTHHRHLKLVAQSGDDEMDHQQLEQDEVDLLSVAMNPKTISPSDSGRMLLRPRR